MFSIAHDSINLKAFQRRWDTFKPWRAHFIGGPVAGQSLSYSRLVSITECSIIIKRANFKKPGANYARSTEVKIKMVKVDGYEIPEGLYYSKDWSWVKIEKGNVRIGMTDYAQKQLRRLEVVFVELPIAGGSVKASEPFGSIESVWAVSDLVAPISGKIEQANQEVTRKPEILHEDPYGKGWLILISPDNLYAEVAALMDFDKSVEWHKSLIARGEVLRSKRILKT